jgi:PIN domain nuclease of toxin-antitoxin system
MTPILLDTHVLLWMVGGNSKLSLGAQQVIQAAAEVEQLYISAITPWEIALLVSKKRIDLGMDVQVWLETALALPGIELYPLLPQIAVASTRLPGEIHNDPADRILVATARHIGAVLITADQLLLQYGAAANLRVMAAG